MLYRCRGCNHIVLLLLGRGVNGHTFSFVPRPILCATGLKKWIEVERTMLHTLWRCSGEQYHAFWHRLHHIEVGMQHIVHGWLMNELGFIVLEEAGLVRQRMGRSYLREACF